MTDRRNGRRRNIPILFNQYVDGQPHLCQVTDLSRTGLSALRLGGPERAPESFALELRLPGDGQVIWAWARRVWRRGRREAVEFVALAPSDARRLDRFLRVHAA